MRIPTERHLKWYYEEETTRYIIFSKYSLFTEQVTDNLGERVAY